MMSATFAKWQSISLILRIVIGMVIGAAFALTMPGNTVVPIFGTLFVGLLKGVAPVLVFVLVISALANAAGDIYYVLQGRDVNGLRSLYPSDSTVLLGMGSPRLFRSMHSSVMLDSFVRDSLSVKQILEKYCIRTPASESAFGFAYGWLDAYDGYRCR